MNKPAYIAVEPEGIAEWMAALDRWVLWKAEFNGTKWTKVPYRVTGRGKASSTNPKTWAKFDDAVEAYTAGSGAFDGIGFVLGDGYAGIDLDHVIAEDGLNDQAAAVLGMFGDCYREKSPSGDGYHIVFRTDYDNPDHVRKLEPFEFYTEGRYFTVTGCSLMSEAKPAEFVEASTVESFHDRYLAGKAPAHSMPAALPAGHSDEVDGATDEELLYVLFEKFPGTWELYNGSTTRYDNDDSRADLALCGALVKVCHGDIARADALFRNSGLFRPKWDELRGSETYGQITLRKAINGYDPAKAPRIAATKPVEEHRDGLSWVFEDGDLLKAGINDKTLGRLFAKYYGDIFAFVPEVNSMYAYDGTRWIRYGAEQLAECAMKDFIDSATMFCSKIEDDRSRAGCLKDISRYQQHKARKNVLDDAKSELVRHADEFDTNPHVLNVLNKTIDFSEGEPVVRDHDPADLITHVAPVTYDPAATCELFESTLATCCDGDVDLIEYIQKLYGKVVASDTSDDAFYLFGEQRRTGKGTVTSPLAEMLGTGEGGYAKNAQPETFAANPRRNASASSGDRARLKDGKLIITSETPKGMELDATIMKEMSGDDLVTARYNYSNDEQFRMRGIIFMLANCFPAINDPSVFGSDRVKVIPFDHVIPKEERDPELRKRLREPDVLSGLLNWCLDGVRKYMQGGFEAPDAVMEATRAYELRCDTVAVYMSERLVPCEDGRILAKDLWADFSRWNNAAARNLLGRNDFYDRIRQRVVWRKRATVNGATMHNVIEGYAFVGEAA